MRYHIIAACSLSGKDVGKQHKIKDAFVKLNADARAGIKASELFPGRMRGLSSYDVLDSTDFSNAKKVEKRLSRYDKRNK